MTIRSVRQLGFLLILPAILLGQSAWGESVNVGVVKFEIDRAEQISDAETKIVVAGAELVVPRFNWQIDALEQCLQSNCYEFNTLDLLNLTLTKDLGSIRWDSLSKFLSVYLKQHLKLAELSTYYRSQLIQGLLNDQTQAAEVVARVCDTRLEFNEVCSEISAFSGRYQIASGLLASGQSQGLLLLLSTLSGAEEISRFSTIITDGVKQIYTKRFSGSGQLSILRLFSLLPKELLTADMLDLVLNHLRSMSKSLVSYSELEDFLSAHLGILGQNPEAMGLLGDLLEYNVSANYLEGDFDTASDFLDIWTSLSEKISTLPGANLIELYSWLRRFGRHDSAIALYNKLLPNLSFTDRLHFLVVKYLPRLNSRVLILMGAFVALLVFLFAAMRLRPKLENVVEDGGRSTFADPEDEDQDRPQKVFSVGALAISPKMLRYRECLRLIGIDKPASVKDIKAAYRVAVKEAHPDMNKDRDSGNNMQSDKFIDLTRAYDEALVLHSQIAGEEEQI